MTAITRPQAPSQSLPVPAYREAQVAYFLAVAQQSRGRKRKLAKIGMVLSMLLQDHNLHGEQKFLLQNTIDDLRSLL